MKRVKYLFGKVIYTLIAQFLPSSFCPFKIGQKQLRRFCGKLMLKNCGKNVNIERRAVFSYDISLGDNSGIGLNSIVSGPCYIGNDVMMGRECHIYTRNHLTDDISHTMRGRGYAEAKPVYIGDDVWIGSRVTILPGVHIGNHCVIGAGAVVPKDIPDWAVAVGNPARVVKYRNQQK